MLSKWRKCTRCVLHATRRNVVLGQGPESAPIVFIGDAPGRSEDLRGTPFVGPEGRMLRTIIEHAAVFAETPIPEYYLMYACACRPCDDKAGPDRQPTGEEFWACYQRMDDEVRMINPRVIILLGGLAELALRKRFPAAIRLQHPAHILMEGGQSSPIFRRAARDLSKVFQEVYDGEEDCEEEEGRNSSIGCRASQRTVRHLKTRRNK